jgi:hypothetical protein
MNRQELEQHVWDSLPVRKHMTGRERVNRIVARTLKDWPIGTLRQCDQGESEVVAKYLARSIERRERAEYGMGFFAMIFLSAIVSEIVKIILRKWLESSEGRLAVTEACR